MSAPRRIPRALATELAENLRCDVPTALKDLRTIVDRLETEHAKGAAVVTWEQLTLGLQMGHPRRLCLMSALEKANIVRWHDSREAFRSGWILC